MKNKEQLLADIATKKAELKRVEERLVNPMASEESYLALLKNKNELVADIQTLEIAYDKLKNPPRTFERVLNETTEL